MIGKNYCIIGFIEFHNIGIYAIIFIINGKLKFTNDIYFGYTFRNNEIFFGSAMSAVIPSMVEKEDLLDANSFNSLVMNIGQLLAPVLGAVIYVVSV